jgi:hypothetical protein
MYDSKTKAVVCLNNDWPFPGTADLLAEQVTKNKDGYLTFPAIILDDTDPHGLLLGSTRNDVKGGVESSDYTLFVPWRYVVTIVSHPGFQGKKKNKLMGFADGFSEIHPKLKGGEGTKK